MKIFTLLVLLFAVINLSYSKQIDPNHIATGGYGYIIDKTSDYTLWWTEGAYKVMRDAPTPTRQSAGVELCSARNEWESFIVVVDPKISMSDVRFELSALQSKTGIISAGNITIRKVEYVKVTHPTDGYGFAGEWPDPLPIYKGGETLILNQNNAFWVSVKTPDSASAGVYTGSVTIKSNLKDIQIPLSLKVWNFTLPNSPSMRSGFGLNSNNVYLYNNITDEQGKREAFERHMKLFSEYKIAPYNPFELSPIKEAVHGIVWDGGFFDSNEKRSGNYAYMLVDDSATKNVEARTREVVSVNGGDGYELSFWAKSKDVGQPFVVGVECYGADDELLWFENRFDEFSASPEWKSYKFPLGRLSSDVAGVKIRLFPSKRTSTGENRGAMWFDDMALTATKQIAQAKAWVQQDDGLAGSGQNNVEQSAEVVAKNLLPQGDFEVDLDKIDIELDFSDFNKAAQKYLGEYGFNGFNLRLKGLGGGTYYSRTGGVFEGFAQGTPEYEKLMERYLRQIETNLKQTGIIGKEYIYWFDEPGEADYPFVHQTNAMIKKYAPLLTTFLTEHVAGQDISDVTDISCTIWHQLNHDKVKKMNDKGLEYWSYLCCWPKSPWISEFIDHDAVNFRMWMWASYVHNLKGILIWETAYWNSPEASPDGKLQNPWEQPMSWVTGYGWVQGKQTIWGNGDGRLIYPENRDVNNDTHTYNSEAIPSLRLEANRDGIEDYEYLVMLEKLIKNAPKNKQTKALKAKKLLEIPKFIYTDEKTYSKDPQAILKYRKSLAQAIESLL